MSMWWRNEGMRRAVTWVGGNCPPVIVRRGWKGNVSMFSGRREKRFAELSIVNGRNGVWSKGMKGEREEWEL